jgi:hypothetical protein
VPEVGITRKPKLPCMVYKKKISVKFNTVEARSTPMKKEQKSNVSCLMCIRKKIVLISRRQKKRLADI